MYNTQKVKSWLKSSVRGRKDRMYYLIHDAENKLVSDTYIIIKTFKDIEPTLLEIFGNLDSGMITADGYENDKRSLLEYINPSEDFLVNPRLTLNANIDCRILLNQDKKILIDCKYSELFLDFDSMTFKGDSSGVYISHFSDFFGFVMPVKIGDDYLQFLEFKY